MTINYGADLRFDEDYLTAYGYLPSQPAGNRVFRSLQHMVERYQTQVLMSLAQGESGESDKPALALKGVGYQLENPDAVSSAAIVFLVELAKAGLLETLSQDNFW